MDTEARLQNPHIARAIQWAGKQSLLAEQIGCAQQTVSKMLNGEVRVPAELAVKIDEVTMGQVAKSQLRPDLFGEASPAPSPEAA